MFYTVYINSNDKISGSNNDATFQINWADFLDLKVDKYKVNFWFATNEDYFSDTATTKYGLATIYLNTDGKSYSFNTVNKSYSNLLGYAEIVPNVYTGDQGYLNSTPSKNITKIIQRPTNNMVNISIKNFSSGLPFVNSNNIGTPNTTMPMWSMVLYFEPI